MILLNERLYAEEILHNKDLGSKPFYALSILARYYYHILGYKKKKITELLIEFMEKYYPRYSVNKISWDENIEKIAKNAGKYPLHEIDEVLITDNEMATIQGIHNKTLERLAFTSLCIAKLNNLKNPNNQGWVNLDEKELFKLARISCSTIERNVKLGKLYELGLIEFPKRNDNMSFRVTYMHDGKTVLKVNDFRELGYEYRQYCGEQFIHCAECGILMKPNKNGTKKYCDNCAGYTPQKYKTVTCIDCGKEFEVNSMNNQTNRCAECYALYRQNYYRLIKQKQRNNG